MPILNGNCSVWDMAMKYLQPKMEKKTETLIYKKIVKTPLVITEGGKANSDRLIKGNKKKT